MKRPYGGFVGALCDLAGLFLFLAAATLVVWVLFVHRFEDHPPPAPPPPMEDTP